MKKSHPLWLLAALVATSLLMSVTGLAIRLSVGRDVEQLQQGPAAAVPLMLMADPTMLKASQVPETTVTPEAPQESEITLSKPGASEAGPGRIPSVDPVETGEPEETAQTPDEETSEPADTGVTFGSVDETYFDDALFIGDSRTVGLSQYGRLGQADYFADVGLTVFNVWDKALSDTGFSDMTLRQLLSERTYGKIYIMLGINEIGYPFSSVLQQYESDLRDIRDLQPNADILLCANLHVTRQAAEATPRLQPDNIAALDSQIAAMADDTQVFFLDVNAVFCDEAGYLREDLTGDGVHPYGTGYETWAQWLQEHGIIRNEEKTRESKTMVSAGGTGM